MGNDDSKAISVVADFLLHPDAVRLFAKVDYALKNGIHIQNYKHQTDLFRFINENQASLQQYYKDYFNIVLDFGGESVDKYFYINFMAQSRGNIPEDNRHFMPNEYVIIGFLLYKIIFIDGYIELNTVGRLQKMIRLDYEELKPGIYRTLAKAKRDKNTKMDGEKVDKIIEDAMQEFSKVGWIMFEGETFDTMPSFHRLPNIYSDYIHNLDEWFKEHNA
jgi:hypothetical protein